MPRRHDDDDDRRGDDDEEDRGPGPDRDGGEPAVSDEADRETFCPEDVARARSRSGSGARAGGIPGGGGYYGRDADFDHEDDFEEIERGEAEEEERAERDPVQDFDPDAETEVFDRDPFNFTEAEIVVRSNEKMVKVMAYLIMKRMRLLGDRPGHARALHQLRLCLALNEDQPCEVEKVLMSLSSEDDESRELVLNLENMVDTGGDEDEMDLEEAEEFFGILTGPQADEADSLFEDLDEAFSKHEENEKRKRCAGAELGEVSDPELWMEMNLPPAEDEPALTEKQRRG